MIFILLISIALSTFILNLSLKISIIDLLKENNDFKIIEKPQTFVGENVYNYLDGGADLYLKNNLLKITVADFSLKKLQFTIEVYEFKNPYDSFKIAKKITDNNLLKGKNLMFYKEEDELIVLKREKLIKIISYSTFPENLKERFLKFFNKL